ncbi:methyltransferase domain-containing protein [Nocardioides zeae]|uniref:Methyltransferase domain-containing protein n=1 Tax=Nocardioides imazamoxiresistens TaxID=3231893 RepID=A0ABU3PZB4_9ACTN|nr:methyltransferase [Nocardioides zeae]MDT9594494.1 methyltransferase domain-containing protein [Nocardioides zeae]
MAADGGPDARPLPAERRADPRTAIVFDTLAGALDQPGRTVVDIGGGTGGSAVRLAASGHHVTVVDPSPDALASLDRRVREAGVGSRLTAHQGDVADLVSLVPEAGADLVLCHGVLEVLDDPAAALDAIVSRLRPGGRLSLVAGQRNALVVARAMAGQFVAARELLDDSAAHGRTGRRFTEAELLDLVGAAGLEVESVHGVRVFADLVPGSLVDAEPGSAAALVELERAVAARAEFRPLATQLHLLARR